MTQEQLQEARRQLDELAKKLGVYIWTCGCCGGAWIADADAGKFPATDIDGNIGSRPE